VSRSIARWAGRGPAAALLVGLVLAPAWLGTPARVAAADDQLRLETMSTYTLDPAHAAVHVLVDIEATNLKPNKVTATTITRYFYRELVFAIHREASRIRATQAGKRLQVTTDRRDTYLQARIRLASDLEYRETTRVRLSYDLAGGAPRSASEIRVGVAFATFYAWAHGDDRLSSVRIVLPAAFDDRVEGSTTERREAGAQIVHEARAVGDVSEWYVVVVADREAALTAERVPLEDREVIVHGWPEDPGWRSEVGDILGRGMPLLQDLVGLPWPVADALDVVEVHTPLLEGYAGVFLTGLHRIEISEALDELTILHEASHAWFDESLFDERWIYEGLADEYASRALRSLGITENPAAGLTTASEGAVRLNEWFHPGRIADDETDAREAFGYDASWTVMRRLVDDVGVEGMRAVLAAAESSQIAYRGEGPPEPVGPRDDWRRFLDLLDEVGGADEADEIFRQWVVTGQEASELNRRSNAREQYRELVGNAGGWSVPIYVRRELGNWQFERAQERIREADAILEARDAIEALAAELELDPSSDLETAWEGATSSLDEAAELAAAELDSLEELDRATDALAAPRDPATEIGLLGVMPGISLGAARDAFEAGDLAGADASARAAEATLAAAPSVGQVRIVAVGGGGAAAAAVLVLYAGVRLRRRRRVSAPVPAGPSTPYATPPTDVLVPVPSPSPEEPIDPVSPVRPDPPPGPAA
jgi:hypothetical protein